MRFRNSLEHDDDTCELIEHNGEVIGYRYETGKPRFYSNYHETQNSDLSVSGATEYNVFKNGIIVKYEHSQVTKTFYKEEVETITEDYTSCSHGIGDKEYIQHCIDKIVTLLGTENTNTVNEEFSGLREMFIFYDVKHYKRESTTKRDPPAPKEESVVQNRNCIGDRCKHVGRSHTICEKKNWFSL